MKYARVLCVVLLLAVLSVGAAAEFTRATRFVYHQPVRYYPTTACAAVEVEVTSPACYRDGIQLCRTLNSGKCFADCARAVHSECIDSVRRATCELPAGWEFEFTERSACLRDAVKACDRQCVLRGTRSDCRRQAYTRCSYIGRIFV
ncbi:hypothetical protein C4580_04595 [Candidatus Woesearchaeota archaeon]|nr:MAG: hypothetical protein C4580_04595 [Candidatus Woesearchaeota archaeon]